ncbi:hypothetical protein BGX38DRAFT_1209119 [Terfezia claveryi]|nr:hypothetical protein BGX38DRAFT_1209119 [Terfezia claveryi]
MFLVPEPSHKREQQANRNSSLHTLSTRPASVSMDYRWIDYCARRHQRTAGKRYFNGLPMD